MQSFLIWHRFAVIIGIIALLVVTYTTILINNFKTPEATLQFFSESKTFYYLSEIIKAHIRNQYPPQLKSNILELTVADTLLTDLVTPSLIERIAEPALQARAKIAQLPTSFAGNTLVLNTKQYTDRLSSTISSLSPPPTLQDAANKLIASVPPEITLVNAKQNPNSVLVTITRTRIFFDNIQIIQRIAAIILTLALVLLLLANLRLLKRLIRGLVWFFGASGVILLFLSFLIPAIAQAASNNPDPVAGMLRDELIGSIVSHYFSLTRNTSLVFIVIAIGLFLVYHFVPMTPVTAWLERHTSSQQASTTSSRKKIIKKAK